MFESSQEEPIPFLCVALEGSGGSGRKLLFPPKILEISSTAHILLALKQGRLSGMISINGSRTLFSFIYLI